MEEYLVLPGILVFLAFSAWISRRSMKWFNGFNLPSGVDVLFAGLLPFFLTAIVIMIWHWIERARYVASGSQEGFMGPGLLLLYGFPIFIIMVVVDILAAISVLRRK
jgi:hypothetical protein